MLSAGACLEWAETMMCTELRCEKKVTEEPGVVLAVTVV